MPRKGIAPSVRRQVLASRAAWLTGVLLVVSCSGSSKFSSDDGDAGDAGDAGESSVGGTSSGSGGTPSGGGTVATGGTSPSGGRGGDATGGFSGTGATGGTDSDGGEAGTSGASGSSSGGSGVGGTSGTGGAGSGGQAGGSAGSGGGANPDCPLRTPSLMCDSEGLVCRYSSLNQCLCTSAQAGTICALDPRCTLLLDRPDRIIIDGGVPDGGAIPVATTTCTCRGGTWSCMIP